MKKILIFFASFMSFYATQAQDYDKAVALQLITKNSKAIGLSDKDLENVIISSSYYNNYAGTRMVYLQQSYLGLPVFNQLQVLAFKNEKLVSAAGERIAGITKLSGRISAVPSVTPESAVRTAMAEKKISTTNSLSAQAKGSTTKLDFGKLDVALENITAELMWVPLETGEVKLAWQVYLVPKTSSDYFLIRVDALSNKIIGESNLTVYCNFGDTHAHEAQCSVSDNTPSTLQQDLSPGLVSTASYLVVPWPAESPNHPGGTPASRTNPWTMAPGNATTLGWHNDGTTDYTITRGNNVHAQEDRDASNSTLGLPGTSTTSPDPLTFDFTPNFTVVPTQTTPVQNQQFNITNLFYWNNIIHDLTYLYGFDEAAGNFQNDNQGRGGAGNDYVIADAQDAGGTNNANFATPADGSKPRMQMYLWSGSPQKDGDVDNGIVVHEYTHGISNRLTGGPASSGCLGNAENMGEGWSDYYSLMYTQDWANSTLTTGFNSPRGIGTYVNGQTPTGGGIRSQRYCTNFAINNRVYAASIPSATHDRGEIWCATLWDMTWNIINQVGTINPNLFNPAGGGGNAIALKLVTEGMKLQPCNPGFISGRDAILQADQILYGGLYNCAIREAFRRRGMGDQASQGSSGSVTDQVTDFFVGAAVKLTQNGTTQVQELQNIVYTNTVTASCTGLLGFTLRDTLPTNVTYVSGGSYNAATRVVSFPVNQLVGSVQPYSFTVNVNSGSYFTPVTLIDEQLTTSLFPSSWTTFSTPAGNEWSVSPGQSVSPPNSFYVDNKVIAADQKLETTNPVTLPAATSPIMSFSHKFNTEEGWDGGVVEISVNGGSWIDLGPRMVTGAYNGTLGAAPTNALSNRTAFTGTINSFMSTSINLTPYAGQSVKFRFRFGSDDNTSAPSGTPGWFVDNILLKVAPVVNMRTSLFNNSEVRVSVSDTITVIVPGVTCTNAAITTQPANTSACAGNNATFSVVATGTSVTYQWQLSTDGGTIWNDIPGAINTSYTANAVTALMDNYRYRAIISNTCPSSITSAAAILTISTSASITAHPSNTTACPGAAATFTVAATGSNLTYQWQVSIDGVNFSNIASATSATLTVSNVTPAMAGNQYRAIVYSCGPAGITSNAATLGVIGGLTISTQPVNAAVCEGNTVSFTVAGSGPGLAYQWQVSTGGGPFTNIGGETNPTLTLTNVSLAQNGNQYRAVLSGTCSTLNSNAATLSINTAVAITTQPADAGGCSGLDANFTVIATGTSITYQWQISANGGPWVDLANGGLYSGVTTNNLHIAPVSTFMTGYRYRVLVSGIPCGAIISNPATLVVSERPGVVLAVAEYANLTPGVRGTLYTTVSPVGIFTYQWYKDGVLLPNVTTSTYPVDIDRFGEYQVTATDANGCSATSNLVRIADSVTKVVFIYPNPNRGQFQVRFHSTVNASKAWMINIYDSKGTKVYHKAYTIGRPYDLMKVNMPHATSGIYLLELLDVNGERLATGRVILQ